MPWDVDIDYNYDTRSTSVSRINSLMAEIGWDHISVSRLANGTFNIDSDWEFEDLTDALTRIQAQAQTPGFTGASLKIGS